MPSTFHFGDRLATRVAELQSSVCVGLDPRWEQLPPAITRGVHRHDLDAIAQATQCYCVEVIDAVASHAAVIKPQAAFFEALGPAGLAALKQVIDHSHKAGLIVVLDAKRGDIGSTAEGYAEAYLGSKSPWSADALTVNPYLGDDTLKPFIKSANENGAGIFVLVKTSNPGSGFLQDLTIDGCTVYERVAAVVQAESKTSVGTSGFGNVGAVVGATYPEQLRELREVMPNAWLLIPGYGAQGGTAQDVAHGFRADGLGAIVNSSRGIIFAYSQPKYAGIDWQEAVARAASAMALELHQATWPS